MIREGVAPRPQGRRPSPETSLDEPDGTAVGGRERLRGAVRSFRVTLLPLPSPDDVEARGSMHRWPFGDADGVPPPDKGWRSEDLFLLWLMHLPLDAHTALAARPLLAESPAPTHDIFLQRWLRGLLTDASETEHAA